MGSIENTTSNAVFWAPIHLAVQSGDDQLIDHLLNLGANINIQNKQGVTPLHLAAQNPDNHNLVSKLIENGANPNLYDNDYETPLFVAIRSLCIRNFQVLVRASEKGYKNKNYQSPLHVACQLGSADIVSDLIINGYEVQESDVSGNTPLHYAVMANSNECVTLLLDAKASVIIRNNNHQSPLVLANAPITQIIKEYISRRINEDAINHELFPQSGNVTPSPSRKSLSNQRSMSPITKSGRIFPLKTNKTSETPRKDELREKKANDFDDLQIQINSAIEETRVLMLEKVKEVEGLLQEIADDFKLKAK